MPKEAEYIGLDYYSTAVDWYGTQPDVFGDARALPFRDESIDHALMLDVLEHVPEPQTCLAELRRVLKSGGSLTIQVPFLYPVHDAPLDFHRWTRFGLRQAAANAGFDIEVESAIGHPLETAALNANIAMSRATINWIKNKNPLAILALLAPFTVLAINAIAWTLALLSSEDDLMPYSYRSIWIKS